MSFLLFFFFVFRKGGGEARFWKEMGKTLVLVFFVNIKDKEFFNDLSVEEEAENLSGKSTKKHRMKEKIAEIE